MKLAVAILLVAYASADVSHIVDKTGEADAQILAQELEVGLEGAYRYAYETANGISGKEQGERRSVSGVNEQAETVQGEVTYTAPDGQVIRLSYTADQDGFNAQGAHLPTSPPIPDAILRSLDYIRAHPPKDIN